MVLAETHMLTQLSHLSGELFINMYLQHLSVVLHTLDISIPKNFNLTKRELCKWCGLQTTGSNN